MFVRLIFVLFVCYRAFYWFLVRSQDKLLTNAWENWCVFLLVVWHTNIAWRRVVWNVSCCDLASIQSVSAIGSIVFLFATYKISYISCFKIDNPSHVIFITCIWFTIVSNLDSSIYGKRCIICCCRIDSNRFLCGITAEIDISSVLDSYKQLVASKYFIVGIRVCSTCEDGDFVVATSVLSEDEFSSVDTHSCTRIGTISHVSESGSFRIELYRWRCCWKSITLEF